MRSLVEGRTDRLAVVDGPGARMLELRALLERASLEVRVLPRALAGARPCPPPDVVLVPGTAAPPLLRALAAHPVLRWAEVVVAPWEALDDGLHQPLRTDTLLKVLREALARRAAAFAEIASGRRAVVPLAPVGPLPLVLAASRSLGTTLVFEAAEARARLSFAHGRFVGGRATDGALLRTVRGTEALSVALRLREAEVFVVQDEEDEPLGTPITEAVSEALAIQPTIAVDEAPCSWRTARAPITLAIPERLPPSDDLAHEETGPFPALPGASPTKRYPAVAKREAAVLLDATRLWHRPIARDVHEAPHPATPRETPIEVGAGELVAVAGGDPTPRCEPLERVLASPVLVSPARSVPPLSGARARAPILALFVGLVGVAAAAWVAWASPAPRGLSRVPRAEGATGQPPATQVVRLEPVYVSAPAVAGTPEPAGASALEAGPSEAAVTDTPRRATAGPRQPREPAWRSLLRRGHRALRRGDENTLGEVLAALGDIGTPEAMSAAAELTTGHRSTPDLEGSETRHADPAPAADGASAAPAS
jgi:hypothetical protein